MQWRKSVIAFFILIITFTCGTFVAGDDKLRICVVVSGHTNRTIQKNCAQLLGSPVECMLGNDRFNCLRKVGEGNSDFTVLGPEDLVAASGWSEFKVLVTNELRFPAEEKHQYQVTALVQNSAGIQRLSDVRGKRFCHPGYESTHDWTPALATYFENTLVEKECDPNKTLIENQVSAASKFFGAACMAGPWTEDSQLDNKLKSRYRNLCALCDNPAGCYSSDKYHGPSGALLCLTDGMGDIAWVRVADALSLFQTLKVNKDDYSYLCSDGSTRSMQTEEPCFWVVRPWPVVLANSKKNEAVSALMAGLSNRSSPWQNMLASLLENYYLTALNPDNLGTPDDYLKRVPGFLDAVIRPSCQPSRTISWCVSTNIEQRKCLWLSQAHSDYGTEPMVSCITRSSRKECIEAVRAGQADLFVVTPEEELLARQRGLKRVVHVFTNKKEDINRIAAVVKRKSNIKSLEQLKGLKACFTGYQSIGWNAFVSIMRNSSGNSWDSSDVKAVSNYFIESCVVGLERNDTMPSNLYSLCRQDSSYSDEARTFKCLVDGGGDVAFISLDTIKQNTGSQNQRSWAHGLKENDYQPICLNESNPDTCFLTWTTLGSVMVHENTSAIKFEEIYTTLLQMDELFGQTFPGRTPAFSMYGSYDENRSVIFPDKTQHLQSDVSHVRLERNYEDIVDDLIANPPRSDATQLSYNYFKLALACIAIVSVRRTVS